MGDGGTDSIHVELEGNEIVVTRSGTDFLLAYKKVFGEPRLIVSRSWVKFSLSTPPINEFRAKAFQAAVSEARELGWIK